MIKFDAIRATAVTEEPFAHFLVPHVLETAALDRVGQDFPAITSPGIFPLETLNYGDGFRELVGDIRSADLEAIMEEKFGVQLSDKPLMVTVRGHCQKKDGRIHTDSTDKIVTCLLYLNADWQQDGGRLRLLRNGSDLNDYIAEVPPNGGTLVAFKRSDNSWHGHLPFEGPRRYVMFNWVRSEAALSRNVTRHRISAKLKQLGILR